MAAGVWGDGAGSSGLDPLLLHFDVNKTVIQTDSLRQDTIDEGLREGIADLFWGRIQKNGDKTTWVWTRSKPSCTLPTDVPEEELLKVMTYAEYCKQVVKDKSERKLQVRSFKLVDGNAKVEMEKLLQLSLKKLELPADIISSPEAEAAGLRGTVIAMFPSLFQLVAMLQRAKRRFALCFRSFGNDHFQIKTEWNAFCEMRHPLYNHLLSGIGPLDGTVQGVPDRRLHHVHTLYRDEVGPVLILDTFTNGPPERSWDSWAKIKPRAAVDTRAGREYIASELKATTIEGFQGLQGWLQKHLASQHTVGIKDDWAWWTWHNEQSYAGKLMPLLCEAHGSKQLFFDDNIDLRDARIVDVRNFAGKPLPPEATLNRLCTKVNPVEAVLDDDYFLRKLQVCHGDHLDVGGASLLDFRSQLAESEQEKDALAKELKLLKMQLANLTEENRRMKLHHCIHVRDESHLRSLLASANVDPESFGTGYRSLENLYRELESGMCWLEQEDNKIVRIFEMVFLKIQFKDLVLIESHEQDSEGNIQTRSYLPGVRKSIKEAAFTESINRWITSGLSVDLKDVILVSGQMPLFVSGATQQTHATQAYPITCKVHQSEVEYFIPEKALLTHKEILSKIGLPGAKHFNTKEEDNQGNSVTRFWRWDKVATWEATASRQRHLDSSEKMVSPKDPQAIDIGKVFDKLFHGHPRREVYELLLLQMFDVFEGKMLTGGFSGSIVIRVQPFEADGRPGDPCIVKLDAGEAIHEEFKNSLAVFNALPDRAARILGDAVYAKNKEGQEFGAFCLELAGACWNIPELAQGTTSLLTIFKDLLLYESEQSMRGSGATAADRPFGNVNSVVAETFGPGGMVSSLRKGTKGLYRAQSSLLSNVFYTLKGKESKYNLFIAKPVEYPPGTLMRKQYQQYFGAEMPDLKELVVGKIKPRLESISSRSGGNLYPLIALAHGDLNAANIMIDALDNLWLIDFATSVDLPLFTDMCKFEMASLFEYATIPITPKVLLEYASREKSKWEKLGVGDWLRVDHDSVNELLRKLAEQPTERLEKMSDIQLDQLIDHVAHSCNTSVHKQRKVVRALKARLTTNEMEMDYAFEYCKTCSRVLLQGDYLLDTLRCQGSAKPHSVFEDGVAGKASQGAASLSFFMDLVLSIRRFMLDDVLGCLRERALDPAGLLPCDVTSMQLWMPILRESFRIVGYRDISPMQKLWSIYHCNLVAQNVLKILDAFEEKIDCLHTLPIMERISHDLVSAKPNQAPIIDSLFRQLPFCTADSQFIGSQKDLLTSSVPHDRIVRKLHSMCPVLAKSPGFFAPVYEVKLIVNDSLMPVSVEVGTTIRPWKVVCEDLTLEAKAILNGFDPTFGGVIGTFSPGAEPDAGPRVTLSSRLLFLRHDFLVNRIAEMEIVQGGYKMQGGGEHEFSLKAWCAQLFGEDTHDRQGSTLHRSRGNGSFSRSFNVPDEFTTFLELEAVVVDELGKEKLTLGIVLGHPALCYSPGSPMCMAPSDPSTNSSDLQGLFCVISLTDSGTYEVRHHEEEKNYDNPREFDPMPGNHVYLTPVSYKVGQTILFSDDIGCWKEGKIIRAADEESDFCYTVAVLNAEDGEEEELSVYLNSMNSGPATLSASAYEEEIQKMTVYYKARNSYIIDALSGIKLDVKTCAEPTLVCRLAPPVLVSSRTEGGVHRKTTRRFSGSSSTTYWSVLASTRGVEPVKMQADLRHRRQEEIADARHGWNTIMQTVDRHAQGQPSCSPKAFLVLGSPGSGKTCLVAKLIMDCGDHHIDLVPLLLPVVEMVRRSQSSDDDHLDAAGVHAWFEKYLRITFGEDSPKYKMIRQAISMHRAFFIFEGLEDGGASRKIIERLIMDIVRDSHLVVVTSRPLIAGSSELMNVSVPMVVMDLQDLSNEQKRAVAQTRHGLKCLQALDQFFKQMRQSQMGQADDQGDEEGGEDVFGNPMMLSMLLCYLNGKENEAETKKGLHDDDSDNVTLTDVYRVAMDVMLQRVQSKQQADRHNKEEKVEQSKRILEKIAMRMHIEGTTEISEKVVDSLLKNSPELQKTWIALKAAIEAGHGIFLKISDGQARFLVKGFQDYFAASEIANSDGGKSLHDELAVGSSRWTRTLEMLAEAWPHRYVPLIENRVWTFKPDAIQGCKPGDNFFHFVGRVGHRPPFQLFKRFSEACRKLLWAKNADRHTPLHVAAERGHYHICVLMLSHGAVLAEEDNQKRMPMHMALISGHFSLAKFLLDRLMEDTRFMRQFSAELDLPAMSLAAEILDGKVTEEQFSARINSDFVELNFFGKAEIVEKKREEGALLSIFWIAANEYERFTRGQRDPKARLTKESWDKLQEWAKNPDTVGLMTTPVLGAMLVLAAIFNLGKISTFRKTFAPDFDEPFEALASILQKFPLLVPSYAKLEINLQQIVLSAIKADFNFGQFLQAENLPASLLPFKQEVNKSRYDGSVNVLGFLLFRIFAAMCGILGMKSLEGSLFMTDQMYRNYSLGLEVIQRLSSESCQHVFNLFLEERAKSQGLEFRIENHESRACVRLVCLSRAFTPEQGKEVLQAFRDLTPEQRSSFAEYLNADGETERGFLLYGSPQLLENARNNTKIGLGCAMVMLLKVYEVASQEYGPPEEMVVTIMLDELVKYTLECSDPEVYEFTKFFITPAPGKKGKMHGSVHLSPWQLCNDPKEQETLAENVDALITEVLLKLVRETGLDKRLKMVFPEMKYYTCDSTDPKLMAAIASQTLGKIFVVFWVASDQHKAFARGQKEGSKISEKSWQELLNLMESGLLKHDILYAAFVAMMIEDLGRIPKFCEQLAPNAVGHKEVLKHVIDTCPKVLPSFARLQPEYRSLIRECLTLDFNFEQFLKAENLPAHLTSVKEMVRKSEDYVNFFLICSFAKLSGSMAAESLEGSLYMTDARFRRFLISAQALKCLDEGGTEQGAYDVLLAHYAEELNMATDFDQSCNLSSYSVSFSTWTERSRHGDAAAMDELRRLRAVVRLACLADVDDEEGRNEVEGAFAALQLSEQSRLATHLNADGIEDTPAHLLRHCPAFLICARRNSRIGLAPAIQILLRVYDAAEKASVGVSERVVTVDLERLVKFADEFIGIAIFQDMQFEITRVSDAELAIIPKVWIPVSSQQTLIDFGKQGIDLANDVLTGKIKEDAFIKACKGIFPELSYFSTSQVYQVKLDQTYGALLAVFWLVSGDRDAFIRGQSEEDQLKERSWAWIQEWMQKDVKLTENTAETLDAILVLMTIHALGKIPAFREELVPGSPPHRHDEALAEILSTRPEVVPSFSRLKLQYKSLIIDSLSVDFKFSQFLQAENVPANLVHMKEKLKPHGDEGFAFFCFRIFAQMCGRQWSSQTQIGELRQGAIFMTETQFQKFRPGLNALQQLHTADAKTAYNAFLLLRGTKAMSRFASPEHQALARLLCLSAASDRETGDFLCEAFEQMPPHERLQLTQCLNNDGILQRPGYVLCDAPALFKNAKNNAHVGLTAALRMLLRAHQACGEYAGTVTVGSSRKEMVVIEFLPLAEWARDAGPEPPCFLDVQLHVDMDIHGGVHSCCVEVEQSHSRRTSRKPTDRESSRSANAFQRLGTVLGVPEVCNNAVSSRTVASISCAALVATTAALTMASPRTVSPQLNIGSMSSAVTRAWLGGASAVVAGYVAMRRQQQRERSAARHSRPPASASDTDDDLSLNSFSRNSSERDGERSRSLRSVRRLKSDLAFLTADDGLANTKKQRSTGFRRYASNTLSDEG